MHKLYFRRIALRDILSVLKHPSRAIKMLLGRPDYLIFVSRVTHQPIEDVLGLLSSIRGSSRKALIAYVSNMPFESPVHWEQAVALYLIVRILKPTYVIETGVGRSTLFILQALKDEATGELYSIDINPKVVQLIPEELAQRWKFIKGSSKEVLPDLLSQVGYINVFFHDSEHSYENMMFEFKTVWPFITKGGILLSHDTDLNTSFEEFSRSVKCTPIYLGRKYIMGAIRKDGD